MRTVGSWLMSYNAWYSMVDRDAKKSKGLKIVRMSLRRFSVALMAMKKMEV